MDYRKRLIEKELKKNMECMGAILVRGPKWCGKTTTCKMYAKSVVEFQNPDMVNRYSSLMETKPSLILQGEKPLLIDEWQIFPQIWNSVKYEVDKNSSIGQFMLTGSSVPPKNDYLHSGAGRFGVIDMFPMSLYESGDSNGKISLTSLFFGNFEIDGIKSEITLENIPYLLARGGWPSLIGTKDNYKTLLKNYLNIICNNDISLIDGKNRNPDLAKKIIKSYARQVSTINSDKALFQDINSNGVIASERTIYEYLNALKNLFVIDEIPAWNTNVRSKTSIRSSAKKTFVDPSLAVCALELTEEDLFCDLNTFGLLFENLVNRDLNIYTKVNGGYLNHYRDRYGLECDNVIHFPGDKFALVEVKLSDSKVPEAINNLKKLNSLIKKNKEKEPVFSMIITATDIAYKTEDNILVVPIGCLKD